MGRFTSHPKYFATARIAFEEPLSRREVPRKQTKIVHSNDPGKTIRKGENVEDAAVNAFSAAFFSMSEIASDKEHRFVLKRQQAECESQLRQFELTGQDCYVLPFQVNHLQP